MVRGFLLSLLVGFLAGIPLLLLSESLGLGALGIYAVIAIATLVSGLASLRLAPQLHERAPVRRTPAARR